MNKKTDAERKTKVLKFRVNKREYEKLKQATAESGLSSMSEYILTKIIATPIIEVSDDEMLPLMKTADSLAEMYNTLAIRVNQKGDLYPNDIKDMKNGIHTLVDKISSLIGQLFCHSADFQSCRGQCTSGSEKKTINALRNQSESV